MVLNFVEEFLIRHTLDIMNSKKNVCENLIKTWINIGFFICTVHNIANYVWVSSLSHSPFTYNKWVLWLTIGCGKWCARSIFKATVEVVSLLKNMTI